MRVFVFVLYVVGFIIASASSSITFKLAADSSGKRAIWYYVIGNVIGALGPLALTFALKRAGPNLVYALCYGGAFAILQIVSWRLFREPLSIYQWAGVACVGIGI